MKHGKVGLAVPRRLVEFWQGRLGPVAGRCIVHLLGWMLFGIIIAGPSPTGVACSNLHSQEPRPVRAEDAKRQAATTAPSLRSPSKIVLPDIHIIGNTDSLAVLKQRLQNAERELRQLQLERNRILKAIEQFEKRLQPSREVKSLPRSTDLAGRPSV